MHCHSVRVIADNVIITHCLAYSARDVCHRLISQVLCVNACRSLSVNQLTGTLPSQLGALTRLTYMCVGRVVYFLFISNPNFRTGLDMCVWCGATENN